MSINELAVEYAQGRRDVPGNMTYENAKLFWKVVREAQQEGTVAR